MIFASDNWAGASERVMAALTEAAATGGRAYGGDNLTAAITERFSRLFEREVAVFLLGTGTAANVLALSHHARPGALAFCHRHAHVNTDESGAAEAIGRLKLVGVDGAHGRYSAEALAATLARYPDGNVHYGQPVAASITQISELGTVYGPAEISAIAAVAKARNLALHMDGARFAGAVASLGIAPADITWRAGVDVLSFGGTKNGCLAAEAVVFFDPAAARDFAYARQRLGHGFSKAWFIAAQFHAYLENDHWLDLARHANRMGARLARRLRENGVARLVTEPAANELFVILPEALAAKLTAAGATFNRWTPECLSPEERPDVGETFIRLITSFRTTEDEVDRFGELLAAG